MAKSVERTKFSERLHKYGLTPDDAQLDTLRISKNGIVHLGSLSQRPSFHAPRLLQCKDIDDIKTWLGIPNSLFEKNPEIAEQRDIRTFPPSLIISTVEAGLKKLDGEKDALTKRILLDDLRKELCKYSTDLSRLTYHYIFGDSRPLLRWKRVLELQMHEWILPVWIYNVIVVEPGAILEFGQGANILSADELIIHPGGSIRAHGVLTLDIGQIKRPN